MKKLVLLASVFCFFYAANATQSTVVTKPASEENANDWTKSTEGTWEGLYEGKTVWYKLNHEDASLLVSADGKKWIPADKATWQDKNGKWLKIDNKELKSSTDGKTWTSVPDSQWEATNGTKCKLDKDGVLWTKAA